MKWIDRGKFLVQAFCEEIAFYRRVLRHPRTPRVSRVLLGCAIAYALSPIDLIPDFIPLAGHLDDVLILPVMIWFSFHLIPREVLAECRAGRSAHTLGNLSVEATADLPWA